LNLCGYLPLSFPRRRGATQLEVDVGRIGSDTDLLIFFSAWQ
jgi:hypothetical protein